MAEYRVAPAGPTNAKIMVVGDVPGKKDFVPFDGMPGKVLKQFMMQVGIDPTEVYMTNLFKYKSFAGNPSKLFDSKGAPVPLLMQGLLELSQEITQVKPNVILAFGSNAMWALCGHTTWGRNKDGLMVWSGVDSHRGSIYECRLVDGVKVIPTYHPTYIAQGGMGDHGAWVCDLQRAKEESAFPEIRRAEKRIFVYKNQQTQLITNPYTREAPVYESAPERTREKLREQLMDEGSLITLDIEYISNKLLCVGMTNHRDEAHVVVINQPRDVEYCSQILTSGRPINAQNAAFEASILEWHYGMELMPHVAFDTMLAAHAANIELPKDLGYLTSIYTNQPYHKGMVDWNLVKRGKQDLDTVWKYNGIDVWTEHEIMEEQLLHDLDDPGVMKVFRHEMELLEVLWGVSKRGIRIDTEKLEKLRVQLNAEFKSMQLALAAFAGKSINVKSRLDVNWLLFERLGMKPVKMNKSGPANDDKTLAALRIKAMTEHQVLVLDLIRDIRSRRTLLSNFLEVGFDDDGRARGHYNPGGTNTGRLSSSKFYPTGNGTNQQNIPRDDRVRRIYAADLGYEFGYSDLERAESLVVAHLTNDPRMLADHAPGTDAHRSLAAVLFDRPEGEITGDQRYMGKQTRHAGNYMQGWKTFMTNVNQRSDKTGVSIDAAEAKRLIGIYRDVHPFLPQWWRDIKQELYRSRTLYNLLGRRRIFYGHVDSILPEAVAFTPQSTVGDTLNVGLLAVHGVRSPLISEEAWEEKAELARQLKALDFQVLNQVHDAIGYQYPIGRRDEVNSLVRKLLSVELTVPKTYETFRIPVEIQVGSSWGDLELYEDDLKITVST